MRGEEDAALLARRLDELAARAERIGQPCFTGFLTPPEADMALASARRQRIEARLEGGYEDAERRMGLLSSAGRTGGALSHCGTGADLAAPECPRPSGCAGKRAGAGHPAFVRGRHRGAARPGVFVPGIPTGGSRGTVADLGGTRANQDARIGSLARSRAAAGVEVRDTVSSLRLDAVVSGGFGLSRAAAADLIAAGHVKLRHVPTQRPDVRVGEGDAISVRGYGRLVIDQVGAPTKKGRLPLRLIRYGASRKH